MLFSYNFYGNEQGQVFKESYNSWKSEFT
jgi:hypothetical protein